MGGIRVHSISSSTSGSLCGQVGLSCRQGALPPPRHDDKAGAIRSSDCLSHSAGGAVGITWDWDMEGGGV